MVGVLEWQGVDSLGEWHGHCIGLLVERIESALRRGGRMKISFFFAWYDLWIGAYWDRNWQTLYICLLPCCVLRLEFMECPGREGK